MSGNIAGGPSCRLQPWAGGQSRDLAKVPVWDDILTPTIFWPLGQNIVMIYWPPLRYFDPLVIINNKVLFSFSYRYKLLDKVCHCFNTSVTNTLPNWTRGSKYRRIFWPPSNNRWQSFVCISYLFDKIYPYIHDIRIISMIFFWHYQKLSQLDPGGEISYHIWTPSSKRWQGFVFVSYLLDEIYHIKIVSMMSWIVIMLSF